MCFTQILSFSSIDSMVQQQKRKLLVYQAVFNAAQRECYRLTCENQRLQGQHRTFLQMAAKQLDESEDITHKLEDLNRLLVSELETSQQAIRKLEEERKAHLALIEDIQNQSQHGRPIAK